MVQNGSSTFKHYTHDESPNWPWLKQPIVNVSGSGDGFAAGFMYGILQGYSTDESIRIGLTIAQRNLRSESAVSKAICPDDVQISKDSWAMKVLETK